jgi:hypothetical protein
MEKMASGRRGGGAVAAAAAAAAAVVKGDAYMNQWTISGEKGVW